MKPANLRELLTAAIDGELTPAERKVARRLLRESESARILYAQLKGDSTRLKKLPRVPAPQELAENVIGVIRDRALTPTPLPPAAKSKFNWAMLPVWVNLVTAAAILIVVSIGSYLYFTTSRDYYARLDRAQDLAKEKRQSLPADVGDNRSSPIERAPTPKEVDQGPTALVTNTSKTGPEIGPSPRVVVADFNASPLPDMVPEIEPFDLNKIRVSQLFDMHELGGDEQARKKLTTEIKKDELVRLDLFCPTTPRALDYVVAALKTRGIAVITDSFVQDRLRRKLTTELVIFTEALTPAEIERLLTTLGSEDVKNGAGEFATVVAAPFLPADLTRLGQLLGVPNVLPKPAKATDKVDGSKPLPEGTASHVAATLSKMGTPTTPPKTEKLAMIVAYSPMNPHPTTSKEIKQFLDRRGERKADAKPLMLVLRTTK